jgi:hypothetical protein
VDDHASGKTKAAQVYGEILVKITRYVG